MLGKSVPAISNRLCLLRLEPSVRKVIAESGLSERHARALLPLPGRRGGCALRVWPLRKSSACRRPSSWWLKHWSVCPCLPDIGE